MNGKHTFLLAVILATFLGIVFTGYYRYIVKQDYSILTDISCDPETEICFVYQCDPETEECETEEPEYYALLERKAYMASSCQEEECLETCGKNEEGCSITYCTEDNAEGVKCSVMSPEEVLE